MNENKSLITKSQYETLVRDISVLFLYQPTITLIAKDETINKIIVDDLDIIYSYETSNATVDAKTHDFLVAYKTLSGVDYQPHKLSNKEIDDVDDKINVLKIFINNSLNTDWAEVLTSFKDTVKPDSNGSTPIVGVVEQQPKPETVETVSVNQGETHSNFNDNFQSQKPFNSEEFIKRNNVNMDQIADSMIYTYATRLYTDDIKNNRFYRFDSKPSIFIWVKWIYIIFGIAFALMYAVAQIVTVSSSELFYFANFIEGDSVALKDFVTRSNWYYYNQGNTSSALFSIFLSIFISGLLIYYLYGQIRNNKNDNVKYSCKISITVLMLFFFILSVIMPLFSVPISPFNWIDKLAFYKDVPPATITLTDESGNSAPRLINNSSSYASLLTLSIFNILSCITLGINVIMAVIIKVIRPKEDIQRIKALIQKYVDDIKSGRITMDGNSPTGNSGFFGGRNPFSPF